MKNTALVFAPPLLSAPLSSSEKKSGYSSATIIHFLQEVQRELALAGEQAIASEEFLNEVIETVENKNGIQLTSVEKSEILAHIEINRRTFGVLQELVDDQSVSDIIISDFSRITVQVGRKNIRTGFELSLPRGIRAFCGKASCEIPNKLFDQKARRGWNDRILRQNSCDAQIGLR